MPTQKMNVTSVSSECMKIIFAVKWIDKESRVCYENKRNIKRLV